MEKELLEYRKSLLAMRNTVGADSELGGHLSNLAEQIKSYETETDRDARARLEKFMAASVAAIQALTRSHQ